MDSKRRSQSYIDREVQSSLVWRVTAHWVLLLAAQSFGVFMWTVLTTYAVGSWNHTLESFLSLAIPMLLVSASLLPVFLLDTVKLSNRFAGPVLRIRRTLAAIVAGEQPQPIAFRENDFWRSLADDFNKAMKIRLAEENRPAETPVESQTV